MSEATGKRPLRGLPSVDEIARSLASMEAAAGAPPGLITEAARSSIEDARSGIISGKREGVSTREIEETALGRLREALMPGLRRVINATGTILHTNLGRAVLCKEAVEAVRLAAGNCINLEIDLKTGERGFRDSLAGPLLIRLTGAEAVSVVNNNAAAVLLVLNTLAEGKEVIISRGELIEIGGSFRLPDIIGKSGCVMKEVGSTNRTHPGDYANAITENTALLLKAHRSNFSVSGYTTDVGLRDLSAIGKRFSIPVVEDLGSGALVEMSLYGLPKEPVVKDRLSMGADIVTFSADKLLGGPQAGIIAGRTDLVQRINKNPLKRALRTDKLTLSALEATLRLYTRPEVLKDSLPVLRQMTKDMDELEDAAEKARALIEASLGRGFTVKVEDSLSVAGGGALPDHSLPTKAVAITHPSYPPEHISRIFLSSDPPILGRINNGKFLLDLRTVENPGDIVPGKQGA